MFHNWLRFPELLENTLTPLANSMTTLTLLRCCASGKGRSAIQGDCSVLCMAFLYAILYNDEEAVANLIICGFSLIWSPFIITPALMSCQYRPC